MEQTARPGTVQIAENTYRLVAPIFEFEALGGIAVKGKAEPVQSYRVVGRKTSPGRTRGIQGLESALIGREREKALLEGLISALDQGKGGAIVCLTGEAGLGKSRLIRELRDSALRYSTLRDSDSPVSRWYETASLSYESGHPYSLFQRLIRRLIGLAPDDSTARLQEQLASLVRLFPPEEQEEIGRLFESLFGLASRSGQPPMEGEAFKRRLFTAMTAFWVEQLRQGPLVLVFDDLHWTDPASAALLQHLLPLVEQGPLLILLAMRPDVHTPGWGVKEAAETKFNQRYTSLQLEPLSAEEGSQLVDSLLAISDLPPRLRSLIQEKTEGNPFFVEEVVRTLIDDGMVIQDEGGAHWRASGDEGEIHIPDNVQALLAARIDRLEEVARNTLQLASVVGRSFYYRVLARVVDLVDDLSAQLLTLQQTQFIEEATRQPELEYIFRHALTQEAAYNAILLRQRRVYHRRVGETLETLFPDRQEELAGTLAFHFFQARDFQRALHYYTLAGDGSYRLYAVIEAAEHYSRAIDCAAKVDEVSSKQLIHLYIRRGRVYKLDNQFEKALRNYQEMIELAQERDDQALRLASLTAQCIFRASSTPLHDRRQAIALAEEALPLARELGDRAEEARVLWGLLLVEISGGDLELGMTYGRQSLEIAREQGLTQQIGYTLHSMAGAFMFLEQYDEARRINREEYEVWRQAGNTPMLADSYLQTASIDLFTGDYQEALSNANEALRIARSIDNKLNQAVAAYYIALALLDQGDIEQAQENLQRGLAIIEQEGLRWLKYAAYSHLIRLYLSMGALDRGEPLAEEIYHERAALIPGFYSFILTRAARLILAQGNLAKAQQIHIDSFQGVDVATAPLWFMSDVTVTGALIHLALGQPEDALSEVRPFVERTRPAGMKANLIEALLVQGKALAAMEELEGAREALREAAEVAEEIRYRRSLWQILAVLAEVETKRGNATAAGTARGRAREIIDYIAEHAGEDGLRETFLAMPEVQSVLSSD
jgi:predicted ATPase